MRAACRKFIETAGPNGRNFHGPHSGYGADRFGLALGDLRTAVGMQVALIASQHKIPVERELRQMLPPEDDGDADWDGDD